MGVINPIFIKFNFHVPNERPPSYWYGLEERMCFFSFCFFLLTFLSSQGSLLTGHTLHSRHLSSISGIGFSGLQARLWQQVSPRNFGGEYPCSIDVNSGEAEGKFWPSLCQYRLFARKLEYCLLRKNILAWRENPLEDEKSKELVGIELTRWQSRGMRDVSWVK